MPSINPIAIPIFKILAAATGVSVILSGIISGLYRQNPQKIALTWQKLGILLAIIFILVGVGSLGRWFFTPVALFLAYWGWRELLYCLEVKYGAIESKALPLGVGIAGVLGGLAGEPEMSIFGIGLSAWGAMSIPMLIRRHPPSAHSILGAAFGILFVTTPVAILLDLVTASYGAFSFLVLVVMGNDGFSQGWGLMAGKTPLVPQISPGKTWEGTLGGTLSCMAIGYLLKFLVPDWPLWQVLAVSFVLSLLSLTGDLMASSLKREAKIKDFGTVLAVTGGILDKNCTNEFLTG